MSRLFKKLITYLKPAWHYTMAFAAGLATMLGIVSYVHPNISVTPLIALDSSRPLSMQFLVTNNGYLTIHDIKYAFGIERIEGKVTFGSFGGPPGVDESSPRFVAPEYKRAKSLDPNQSDSLSIDFNIFRMAEPIRKADIGIIVSFRLWFIPWHQERVYHFVTQKAADGNLYWFPKPLDN